jgi:hypothetical protein
MDLEMVSGAGLPDFYLFRGKIYQIVTTLPNGRKYTKTAVIYSKRP